MLLADSLKEIHPEKLPGVLKSYIREGRTAEVRQAIPGLSEQHPHLRQMFKEVLKSLDKDSQSLEMISGRSGVAITCANCGGSVSKQSPKTATVICQYCGCDAEEVQPDGLSRWRGKIDTQAKFSIGSYFNFRGQKWQAIGVQKFSGRVKEWDSEDKRWDFYPSRYILWWMLNEQRQLAWLSDYGKERYWSTPYLPQNPELPADGKKQIEYGDLRLEFAAGEFSYHPKLADQKKTWEYSRPPKTENREDSDGKSYSYSTQARLDNEGELEEVEFFRSIKISNKEILKGLGSNELLANVKRWKLTAALLAGAGVLSFATGFILKATANSDNLLTKELVYENRDAQPLGELRIEDTPALVRFHNRLNGRLPANRYAEFEVELTDSTDNFAGGYYVEFWRETGYDEGPWDEADYHVARDLRIDEPGTYTVEGIMGESNADFPFKVNVSVTSNPVTTQPFFFALFAGIATSILSLTRSRSLASSGASLGGRMAKSQGKGRPVKQNKKNKRNKTRNSNKNKKADK